MAKNKGFKDKFKVGKNINFIIKFSYSKGEVMEYEIT
jgi:hypothetical protein